MEEDRETITTCTASVPYSSYSIDCSLIGIKRTKLRLLRCRVRMGMNDKDRLRDARLDKNLDDVQRDPPPWEIASPDPPKLAPSTSHRP